MPDHRPETSHDGDVIAERYRLHRLIGTGGMADVWEATDERLRRNVAVKILRPEAGGSREDARLARERFRAEAQMAARQVHRCIVAVYDAGEDGGRAFLVMERLSGETLRDRLALGGLSDDEARAVMGDVLAALATAHEAGIAHRDIKPGNILRGDDACWKVADFGIAKPLDGPDEADLTRTGLVIGTPRYMAPERLAGHPATAASDLYSVGVILRQCIEDRADADPTLRAAADRASALDPAERFASARWMAQAIERPEGAETVISTHPSGEGDGDATLVDHRPIAGATETIATHGPPTLALATTPTGPNRARRAAGLVGIAALLLLGAVGASALSGGDDPEPSRSGAPASATTTTSAPPVTEATTTIAPATTEQPTTTAPAPIPEPKGKGKGKDKGPDGKAKPKG
jgi:hypothetical protein